MRIIKHITIWYVHVPSMLMRLTCTVIAKGKTSMHRKVSYHVVIVFTMIAKGKASIHRKMSYPVVLV